MIINGQAPANATLLTDDEMRNIKAMYHYEWVKHTYWEPGYVYYTYRWVGFTVSIPYLYLQWVPGHYLWGGWLPLPGHFEIRRGVYTKTIGRWIRIPHYVPPRKKTYYTYEKVYDFNWRRLAAIGGIGLGIFMVGGGIAGSVQVRVLHLSLQFP